MDPKGSLLCQQDPQAGPVLSQMTALHIFPHNISRIQSSKWFPSFRFSYQNFVFISRFSYNAAVLINKAECCWRKGKGASG
jgi:hypothetical protein